MAVGAVAAGAADGRLLSTYGIWVKTLPGSSRPAAVAQPRHLPSRRRRRRPRSSERARVERPILVFLAMLASAGVKVLPEGFVGARLQHFCCYRRSLACGYGVPRVFVVPARWPVTAKAPSCACVCLCSTQWLSAALDLAGVVSSGCFAATPSLSLGSLADALTDALPSLSLASSLADAWLLRV